MPRAEIVSASRTIKLYGRERNAYEPGRPLLRSAIKFSPKLLCTDESIVAGSAALISRSKLRRSAVTTGRCQLDEIQSRAKFPNAGGFRRVFAEDNLIRRYHGNCVNGASGGSRRCKAPGICKRNCRATSRTFFTRNVESVALFRIRGTRGLRCEDSFYGIFLGAARPSLGLPQRFLKC